MIKHSICDRIEDGHKSVLARAPTTREEQLLHVPRLDNHQSFGLHFTGLRQTNSCGDEESNYKI